MSVRGEFIRVLGSFIEFLEASEARGADRAADALRAIHAAEVRDLSESARAALACCEEGGIVVELRFATETERARCADNAQHLVAVCNAVLGRGND